ALGGGGARLILQNPDDVALFERAGLVDSSRVRLIHGSGVDCSRFDAREGGTVDDGPLRVLLPARRLWDKGSAEDVEAARKVEAEGRSILLLGEGEAEPGNAAVEPEDTLRGWVEEGVLPWRGHAANMPHVLAGGHVVDRPRYRGGLPKRLIEAAAC